MVEKPPANAGDIRDMGSIPGTGSSPGGGDGEPPQHSCLGNPMKEPGGLRQLRQLSRQLSLPLSTEESPDAGYFTHSLDCFLNTCLLMCVCVFLKDPPHPYIMLYTKQSGHEFEQALGLGDGQGSLACYSPRGAESWT